MSKVQVAFGTMEFQENCFLDLLTFSNLAFEAFDAIAYLIIEIRAVIVEIDRNCTNNEERIDWHVRYD